MVSEDGRYAITFNGEIYNFRELRAALLGEGVAFRGHSDTEVILNGLIRHGSAYIKQFRGMFAFAFWDRDRSSALLARDGFGIKPLYYAQSGAALYFASEIRALLRAGVVTPVISREAVSSYLSYGSVSEPLSIIDGIRALPPGTVAEVRFDGAAVRMGPPENFGCDPLIDGADREIDPGTAPKRVLAALRDSVQRHLVSDVPVALFLSGGIDSAAVAALASESSASSLNSFTITFSEREFSESDIARRVAQRYGLTHHETPLSGSQLLEMLPDAFASMDQPSMDGLNTYAISRAVHSHGMKVVLSGLGGDELFAGYPSFTRARSMARLHRAVPDVWSAAAALIGGSRGPRSEKIRMLLDDPDPARAAYNASRTLFVDDRVRELLGTLDQPKLAAPPNNLSLLRRVTWYELRGYMLNTLLRDSDVFSMANSLELRVPFVDEELVRTVAAIADDPKMRGNRPKPLLVEALGDLIPREVWDRPKQGFALPFKTWLRGPLYEEVDSVFRSELLGRVGIDRSRALDVWDGYTANRGVTWSRPWALYTLVRWAECNGATIEPATVPKSRPRGMRNAPTMRDGKAGGPTIHLWSPDMFDFKGGIQVYQLDLLTALSGIVPSERLSVFLKNDSGVRDVPRELADVRFSFAGGAPPVLRTPHFLQQIVTRALSERPDVILVGHLNFAAAAHMLHHTAGIRYWLIAYGLEAWDVTNPLVRGAIHHAEKIIAISEYTRQRLIREQGVEPWRVVLLPPTFDDSAFYPTPKPVHLLERYGLQPDQPVIATVARLADEERYKGYDQVMEALPAIQREFPSVRYLLIGHGNDRARIERMIAEKNLQHAVTLAGFVPDAELRDHYNLCDVFAMPSKREGFGIVYVESAACGKAVLGGKKDGAVDALANGAFGALVDPDDVAAIAHRITQLLRGEYPSALMYDPQRLREAVVDKFGIGTFRRTLAAYVAEIARRDALPQHS